MEPNDPSYTEWQAWQLVVSRFEALVGHINDEQQGFRDEELF